MTPHICASFLCSVSSLDGYLFHPSRGFLRPWLLLWLAVEAGWGAAAAGWGVAVSGWRLIVGGVRTRLGGASKIMLWAPLFKSF